jgi:deoxyribonuclease-4
MNLCSAKPETRQNGFEMLAQDLQRMELIPGNLYNFHPGAHTGQGIETGITQIANALNQLLKPEMNTTVLLETMAGKGSEVGGTFEELAEIIARVECREKLGVCFDTCHTWDAGYDLVNDFDGVLKHFDDVIGLNRLKAIHFNDSKNPCGSHKDRNEKLGQGFIGMEAMKRIAQHPLLQGLPFILETPNDDEGYMEEIQTVKEWFT